MRWRFYREEVIINSLHLPGVPVGQSFVGLSMVHQLAALSFTKDRWIRHQHDVHTQISAKLRRITDDSVLEFSPFLVFLEDAFQKHGGAGDPTSDDDGGDDDNGGGDDANFVE